MHTLGPRFAAFTSDQSKRIQIAREGRDLKNPVTTVMEQYLPKPEPELFLPEMNPQFANDLVDAMANRYDEGDCLGRLPSEIRKMYREELKELTDQLEAAWFKIPEKVVNAFEKAYAVATKPDKHDRY